MMKLTNLARLIFTVAIVSLATSTLHAQSFSDRLNAQSQTKDTVKLRALLADWEKINPGDLELYMAGNL